MVLRSPTAVVPSLPVYEQVANVIEHYIDSGRYAPGQRIFSIRELCEEFRIGDVTAKRVLRRLSARGVIRTVAGSGAYVLAKGNGGADTAKLTGVGLVMLGPHPRAIFQYEIDLIQQQLQKLGHHLVYHVAGSADALPGVLDQQAAARIGSLIVFPRHGELARIAEEIAVLRRSALPLLILESVSDQDPYVAADIEGASALLVEHLCALGHRRLCLVTEFARKITGFERAVMQRRDAALQPQVLRCGSNSHRLMIGAAQQVLALQPRPTAVIACNDRMAEVFIECFLAAGLAVPADISVATYDDHPDLAALSPIPVTAARHPSLEIAQEVAQWAHARFLHPHTSGPRFRRIITGSLIARDSTGRA